MNKTSIICIGDELLIGQVFDTNSAWIAQELIKIGISVQRRVAVGDNWDLIWNALDDELKISSIVILTGGLGPTSDDITKPLLVKYFGSKLVENAKAKQNIINIFNKLNKPITTRNLLQAQVPDNCKVLQNLMGTAPGMWFEKNGKIIISLPGVPHEMKNLMELKILPEFKILFNSIHIEMRTLITYGISESYLADILNDFEESLPKNLKLAYLPNHRYVRLRISNEGSLKNKVIEEIEKYFKILQKKVAHYLVTTEDEQMEMVLGKLLKSINKTVGTAESCTGGNIAHLLTTIPGSSNFFKGSIVCYSEEVKENILMIEKDVISTNGVVSKKVATMMAIGALEKLKTDYVIAVTGIMGPDGAEPYKPVGTTWFAFGSKENIQTKKIHFKYEREKNIQLASIVGMNFLRKYILEEN